MNYFDELKQSMEEAVAFNKGDKTRAHSVVRELPVPEHSPQDMATISTYPPGRFTSCNANPLKLAGFT